MSQVRPSVTLIVPTRNEEQHIDRCLEALTAQMYPAHRLTVMVVDGQSTDRTREVVGRWMERDPRVRLLDNPRRVMPAGLNVGIQAATTDLVGVISGHSAVDPDYVDHTVTLLQDSGAASVGGRIERVATTAWQRAIAAATSSPIGVGDSRHNYSTRGQWVETVFPGMWRRSLFDEIGLFDPDMVANEDNELSYRIRRSGGRIRYDPSIVVRYIPRGSLRQLFKQYHSYGFGKVRVWRKHHGGLRWRHLVPPVWLAFLVVVGLLGLLTPPLRVAWLGVVLVYLALVMAESIRLRRAGASTARVAAALVTLHFAYAIGIWSGIFEMGRR